MKPKNPSGPKRPHDGESNKKKLRDLMIPKQSQLVLVWAQIQAIIDGILMHRKRLWSVLTGNDPHKEQSVEARLRIVKTVLAQYESAQCEVEVAYFTEALEKMKNFLMGGVLDPGREGKFLESVIDAAKARLEGEDQDEEDQSVLFSPHRSMLGMTNRERYQVVYLSELFDCTTLRNAPTEVQRMALDRLSLSSMYLSCLENTDEVLIPNLILALNQTLHHALYAKRREEARTLPQDNAGHWMRGLQEISGLPMNMALNYLHMAWGSQHEDDASMLTGSCQIPSLSQRAEDKIIVSQKLQRPRKNNEKNHILKILGPARKQSTAAALQAALDSLLPGYEQTALISPGAAILALCRSLDNEDSIHFGICKDHFAHLKDVKDRNIGNFDRIQHYMDLCTFPSLEQAESFESFVSEVAMYNIIFSKEIGLHKDYSQADPFDTHHGSEDPEKMSHQDLSYLALRIKRAFQDAKSAEEVIAMLFPTKYPVELMLKDGKGQANWMDTRFRLLSTHLVSLFRDDRKCKEFLLMVFHSFRAFTSREWEENGIFNILQTSAQELDPSVPADDHFPMMPNVFHGGYAEDFLMPSEHLEPVIRESWKREADVYEVSDFLPTHDHEQEFLDTYEKALRTVLSYTARQIRFAHTTRNMAATVFAGHTRKYFMLNALLLEDLVSRHPKVRVFEGKAHLSVQDLLPDFYDEIDGLRLISVHGNDLHVLEWDAQLFKIKK